MILPGNIFYQRGFSKVRLLTNAAFLMVALNVLIYLFTFTPDGFSTGQVYKALAQPSAHRQMKKMYLGFQSPTTYQQALKAIEEDPFVFLKDRQFLAVAPTMTFAGDQVLIAKNKVFLSQIHDYLERSNEGNYGLSFGAVTPFNWITYQFMHAGILHLISNCIFLFLITSILQKIVSDAWIGAVYLASGIGAGICYLTMSSSMSLPLVGASGSISGLVAFLCVVQGSKNMVWSYFVGPQKAGFGTIYMPTYLLFPVNLLTDFTNVLVHVGGVTQNIAHSAHVGGALCGFTLGLCYLRLTLHLYSTTVS